MTTPKLPTSSERRAYSETSEVDVIVDALTKAQDLVVEVEESGAFDRLDEAGVIRSALRLARRMRKRGPVAWGVWENGRFQFADHNERAAQAMAEDIRGMPDCRGGVEVRPLYAVKEVVGI